MLLMRIVFINVKKGISKLGCWAALIHTAFLHEDDLVSVDELPRMIKIYDSNIDINIELQNLQEGVASQVESFSQDIVSASDVCCQGYLIFICSYTIAVILSFGTNGDLSSYFCLMHIAEAIMVSLFVTLAFQYYYNSRTYVRLKNIQNWHMKLPIVLSLCISSFNI